MKVFLNLGPSALGRGKPSPALGRMRKFNIPSLYMTDIPPINFRYNLEREKNVLKVLQEYPRRQ